MNNYSEGQQNHRNGDGEDEDGDVAHGVSLIGERSD